VRWRISAMTAGEANRPPPWGAVSTERVLAAIAMPDEPLLPRIFVCCRNYTREPADK
jgi:hypothetical protein